VKTTKIMFIVVFVLALFVFSGLVYAFDETSLSAYPIFSSQTLNVGSTVTVRITVQSNVDEELQISHIGVNFDWMDPSGFYGPDLSSNPAVVPNNGTYTTPPFIVQIPTNVTVGEHTYYVGVDGIETSNQNEFFWNSTVATIMVLPANTTGTTSTITISPTGGGGGQTTTSSTSPLTLIIYLAVAAIVVVVVLALIVMVVQKKSKPKPSAPATAAPADEQPKKPDEEQNKKEQKDNFDAQI
jgi:flagellar basal body-associated protein FliL